MASETKEQPGSAMATDAAAGGADDERDREERDARDEGRRPEKAKPGYAGPATSRPRGPGFFTIYKKGQGYWTRMGTAISAALLGVLTAYHLYAWLPALIHLGSSPEAQARARHIAVIAAAAFFVAFVGLIWWVTNKPTNVDFLIATDSEMKKVNWTSRRELVGSTKVVIVFMFLIAIFLFVVDVLFGYLFYVIGVLKNSPFGGGGTIGGG
jgi:preprotein translocase SecE subunit